LGVSSVKQNGAKKGRQILRERKKEDDVKIQKAQCKKYSLRHQKKKRALLWQTPGFLGKGDDRGQASDNKKDCFGRLI